MIPQKISERQQETCNRINALFEEAYAENIHISEAKTLADGFWIYLQECENIYLSGSLKRTAQHQDSENILALYYLNKMIDLGHLTSLLREKFDLPKTKVTEELAKEWNYAGWLKGDGTIMAASKYCQLDYEWSLVLVYYYYYKIRPDKKHPFVPAATKVLNKEIPRQATVAIIGDWGTGVWKDGSKEKCPAQLVIDGVLALNPDYIVHLGDVYYAGTKDEERAHFLNMIPNSYKGTVYTMNSNHEMYDGANGLMGTTLRENRFEAQRGSTYFSFEIGDWILVGLDSAYYDDSYLYFKGSLTKDGKGQEQLEYLHKAYKTGKKVMLMTHHNGIEIEKGAPKVNDLLWNQVLGAMNHKVPDAWYWGHEHIGVAYNESLTIYNGEKSKMRCCGHASIPFGAASDIEALSSGPNPDVLYYSHTPMPNPGTEVQKLRVLNGFAMVTIHGSSFEEAFYEVSNEQLIPEKVWSNC